MIRQSLDALARFSPGFRRTMMRLWYESLVVIDRKKEITFMNYGYAPIEGAARTINLSEKDEENRYAIQLYHHVASALDLKDLVVVEIGSGRGGGAAYISAALKPNSMRGIDISKNAVEFCNKYYSNDLLSFAHGDAEHIPLANNAVDAVINIESSHCYGSMSRFLTEVKRVLQPGGFLLFADHRDLDQMPLLRQQLRDADFEIVNESDITANVVRALRLDHERKQRLIKNSCPALLQQEAGEFAALVGTRTFESFNSGHSRYVSFVAQACPSQE